VSQSIGDFFVKIGLKVDNQQSLNGLTTRLNNAATAANELAKNLNKIPTALAKLNIPIIVNKTSGGKASAGDGKSNQYESAIGPKQSYTQYNEKAGPTFTSWINESKKRQAAEKQTLELNLKKDKQQKDKQKLDELQLKTGAKLFNQLAKGKGSLSELATAFGEVGVETAAATAIFGGVAIGLGKIAQYATKAGENLFQFNLITGASVKSLQNWQFAASQFGAKGEDVASAIANIQQAQTDIQLNQGNMAPWALLGINPNQDPFAVLAQIHEKVKEGGEISAAMGRKLTAQLGINDSTFQMLRRADLSVLQLKEDMAISSENTKAFDKVNQAMGIMEHKFGVVAQKIGTMLAPAALGFAELLDDIADISLRVIKAFDDFDKTSFGQWISNMTNKLDEFTDPLRVFHDTVTSLKNGTFLRDQFGIGGGADLNNNLPNNSTNTSNNTNNNNITVHISGAGDPKAVVQEMHKQINKSFSQSYGIASGLGMVGSTAY